MSQETVSQRDPFGSYLKSIRLIERVERMASSRNGNPAFRFHFADGTSARSKADAAFSYSVDSSWAGHDAYVWINARGFIVNAEPVNRF